MYFHALICIASCVFLYLYWYLFAQYNLSWQQPFLVACYGWKSLIVGNYFKLSSFPSQKVAAKI